MSQTPSLSAPLEFAFLRPPRANITNGDGTFTGGRLVPIEDESTVNLGEYLQYGEDLPSHSDALKQTHALPCVISRAINVCRYRWRAQSQS